MSLHFHLRNKKVLGRKATTFQPKKLAPTGKKKDSPHSFTKARQVSLLFSSGSIASQKAEELTMPLAQMPNFEEVGNTPREGNEEHR